MLMVSHKLASLSLYQGPRPNGHLWENAISRVQTRGAPNLVDHRKASFLTLKGAFFWCLHAGRLHPLRVAPIMSGFSIAWTRPYAVCSFPDASETTPGLGASGINALPMWDMLMRTSRTLARMHAHGIHRHRIALETLSNFLVLDKALKAKYNMPTSEAAWHYETRISVQMCSLPATQKQWMAE
ncbi:hypothetical protein VNO77_02167 [Canavalia gladiata]|uniref:Uncharacterized protein n=1 Tax=Canavalia gladiata TaxID=3824 RepID=A0AAN9R2T0_CANGL